MPACHAAHRFPSLQRLLNQTNLLVVAPPTPTFRAQHLHLHSQYDLKARFKVTSSDEQPNYTRRPSPERYSYSQSIIHLDAMLPDGALDCEMPSRSCAGQAILPCERLQSRSRSDDRGLTRENLMQVTSWRAQPRVGGRSSAAYLR